MKSKIFRSESKHGRQVALACLLSFVLFWIGLQGWGHVVERKLVTLVSPIHYVMDAPIQGVRWLVMNAKTQHDLLTENAKLRAHQFLLESKVQRLLTLQRENRQLKLLYGSAKPLRDSVQVTRLIAISLDPALNEWLINSGRLQGVTVGQPVLDAFGVVGQVRSVADSTAKVLLLTDSKGAIPVQNSRTGERAIAVGGGGKSQLVLRGVEKTADIRPTDIYISSGLAQRFPFGYPVGKVEGVNRDNAKQFLTVNMRVAAHLGQSNQLLLVKANAKMRSKKR
jgi:rod shape-determining protein MreC